MGRWPRDKGVDMGGASACHWLRAAPRGTRYALFGLALAACSSPANVATQSAPAANEPVFEAAPADTADNPAPDIAVQSSAPSMAYQSLASTQSGNLWLHTHAKTTTSDPVAAGIYRADNTRWQGRGVVIHDTRGCDSCGWKTKYDPTETLRRIDVAVDQHKANVLRLAIESYSSADQGNSGSQRVSWQSLLFDDAYLANLKTIVDYIGTKRGVYVQISMWRDASFAADGSLRPTVDSLTKPGTLCDSLQAKGTPTTTCTWRKLAQTFRDYPYVMFNVEGEIASNTDGAADGTIFNLLNACVQTIRNVEDQAGTPHHIISVPGTRDWARSVAYYASTSSNGQPVLHPITAGGGDNVAYQSHPYAGAASFNKLFLDTAKYLPVIIGEFGPYLMTYDDMQTLINVADSGKLPYIAWSMHPNCGPATMLTEPGNQCDGSNAAQIGYTTWGAWLLPKLRANLSDDPAYTTPAASPSPSPTPTPTPTPIAVTNLARGKPATQSSTNGDAVAALAVDGNPSTLWSAGTIAHTADRPGTTDPWWQVDLGEVKTLSSLTVLGRSDCCSERLQGAVAFVSSQPFSSARVAPLLSDASVTMVPIGRYLNGGTATATLQNLKGRYVRIALPGDGQILAMAEVLVMGL